MVSLYFEGTIWVDGLAFLNPLHPKIRRVLSIKVPLAIDNQLPIQLLFSISPTDKVVNVSILHFLLANLTCRITPQESLLRLARAHGVEKILNVVRIICIGTLP
jgi:hypothetical protein